MTMSFAFPPQAAEDNEMSLVEGEMIEQIEEVVEGWWSGVGQGGAKTGLFPGAYPGSADTECPSHLIGCSKLCGARRDAGSAGGTGRGGSTAASTTTTTTTTAAASAASCTRRGMSLQVLGRRTRFDFGFV